MPYLLQILCGPVVLAEQITESRSVPEGLRRLQKLAQLRCRDGAQHLQEENRSGGLRWEESERERSVAAVPQASCSQGSETGRCSGPEIRNEGKKS